MGGKRGTNAKAETGRARKEEQAAKKKAEEEKRREASEAEEWKKGANLKKEARDAAAVEKMDEAARKRREKAALLAAEEEALGKGGTTKKTPGGAQRKKNKKKNDLALLEDALQAEADKKVRKNRERVLQKKQEQEKPREETPVAVDPLLANTDEMIGGAIDEEEVGRKANVARMQEEHASGIDAALESLNVSTAVGGTPVKSAKALYKGFEERMLPDVKQEYPNLKLSQYKEKVWQLWRKSPDNPSNQGPPL